MLNILYASVAITLLCIDVYIIALVVVMFKKPKKESLVIKEVKHEQTLSSVAAEPKPSVRLDFSKSKVPDIPPENFSTILKNPPRAQGGFGVVIKEDKNKDV